jgi:ubiquinone/menaquinone biosynthesis C-methylase UbiE
MSKFAFRTIVVIHDNPLLPLFNDPYKQLKAAGLKPGQKVLEVGCGPGYFTIPAAKIVGESGVVYAVDLNPYAIKHVQKKIAESGIENIQPMCTNASDTGLADKSIDVAFLFGLPRIAGGDAALFLELQRLIKPGAILACGKSRGSGKERIQRWQRYGFFIENTNGGIMRFLKKESAKIY